MKDLILVKDCSDRSRWYSQYIGQKFLLRKEHKDEYETRQPEGYINFILKKDAVLEKAP